MTDAAAVAADAASSQRLEEASLLKEKNKSVVLENGSEATERLKVNGGGGDSLDSSLVVTAKTNGHGGVHNGGRNHDDDLNGGENGHADLNDVIQHQLQPLLESVSLNGASMNELQQQLVAQFKQQNAQGSGGNLMLANSNGSSSSTSPPLKTSESSISPTAHQSSSHQISSASSSSILSSGSHSNNWNGQQQQSSLSSISPNDEATGSAGQSNLLENISNAAAAAAWTSALNESSRQQISPSQNSNGAATMASLSQQQSQVNPAALASLLKANNLVGGGGGQSSNMINSIYSPTQIQQMLKSGNQSPATMAALAALVDSSAKMNGNQQQRSLITNNSNGGSQPGRNGFIGENGSGHVDDQQERAGQQNGPLDLSMFNGHLVELMKSDQTQLEQILKLRNMYQTGGNEETNGGVAGPTNANGNTFMEELAQQLDQTVPANLAAAVAAAAAANNGLSFANPANSAGRNPSARSMLNMQKYGQQQHYQHSHSNGHHHHQHQQHNYNNNNHHNHYQQSYQNSNGNGHHNSMMSNGNGHIMMSHGYANMQKPQQHQTGSYQHHHYQPQQQFGGAYHPNQFPAINPNTQQQLYHQNFMNMTLQQQQQFNQYQDYHEERFSRKVFVGGLPPDIDEDEIVTHFRRYGNLIVDWPHKAESKSYFPPKGYAFLIFQEERNVQDLIETCVMDDGKLYMVVSSPSMKDKPVQIRPWCLADSDFVMDGSQPLDPRKTIFVGGVPRPLKAIELAMIMDRLYGGVCYAGIDTDPELKYPKGAGRVAFSNQQSYIAAISARFVQLHHGEIDKRVEVKPYVLDDQMCDECQGARCGGKFAPFFCANVTCLQYYCEQCWTTIHSRPGREYHKPLVKEGADRPRTLPYPKSSKSRETYD